MKSRRQALKLCLNTAIVVVVEIVHKLRFEMVNGLEILQIEQFAFKQTKEILPNSVV